MADIVRGIGADFCAYGDAIEEQQIYGGMLYSLTHVDFNDLLVRTLVVVCSAWTVGTSSFPRVAFIDFRPRSLKNHVGVVNVSHLARITAVLRKFPVDVLAAAVENSAILQQKHHQEHHQEQEKEQEKEQEQEQEQHHQYGKSNCVA